MDNKTLAESLLNDPWMDTDGLPAKRHKMLTAGMLALCDRIDALCFTLTEMADDE